MLVTSVESERRATREGQGQGKQIGDEAERWRQGVLIGKIDYEMGDGEWDERRADV
jgi:hypothetical protein